MCKNYKVQHQVIEQAKQDTPEVYALYEQGDNLVGLVKVFNRTLAMFYNVHRYGDTELYAHTSTEGVGFKLIKRVFGVDDPMLRGMYRVVPC